MCNACVAFKLPSTVFHSEFSTNGRDVVSPMTTAAFLALGDFEAAALPPAEAGPDLPTGNPLIDGLLMGSKWTSPVLTYSFPSSEEQLDGVADGVYSSSGGFVYENLALISPMQREAVRQMLEGTSLSSGAFWTGVSDFTNLDFAEINGFGQGEGSGAGDIRITQATLTPGVGGWASYPANTAEAGDVWISGNPFVHQGAIWDQREPVPGNYAWRLMIHELGHALGLKHGHAAAGGGFGALPAEWDSSEFTTMTYRAYIGQSPVASVSEYWSFPQSWMMLDILALQQLYGADYGHHAGDTTYSWSPTTGQMSINGIGQIAPGGNKIFLTIWDGGGTDTYDMSNYADNVSIDLYPGYWSTTADVQRADLNIDEQSKPAQFARGNIYNSLLFENNQASLIENARGGSGHDTITGNNAANVLEGGLGDDQLLGDEGDDALHGDEGKDALHGDAGNDTLIGGAGADTLRGGLGADSLVGGADNDTYYVDGLDTVQEAVGGGKDVIHASASFTLTAGLEIEEFRGLGGGLQLVGNERGNEIYGGSGNDTLIGAAGGDALVGNGGADLLIGGADNDTYYVDGLDTVQEAVGGGRDVVFASANFTLGAGQEIELLRALAGAVGLRLTGNELANTIQGDAGADTLSGGGGNDTLPGRSGNDTLSGDEGDDSLSGGNGDDTLSGDAGADTLDGGVGADSLSGGAGNDTYYVDGLDTVQEAVGGGRDVIYASASFTLTAGLEIEEFRGLGGGLQLVGNERGNEIYGGSGNDTLNGATGTDVLVGNGGADLLIGGAGIDTAYGGSGQDTFVLSYLFADRDVIKDFVGSTDFLQVSVSSFGGGLIVGSLAADQFLANATGLAGDADDRFIYNTSSGILFYDVDGADAGEFVQIATLSGVPTLAASDFILFA
jgi:serralysin